MYTTEMAAHSEAVAVEVMDNAASDAQARAINPATIAAFAALGAQALEFAGRLIGGKTGDALSDIANVINGIGFKLQTIGGELKLLLENVQDVIDSIDKQQLARVWPVHSEVMAYREAFPQGVPAQAATNNPNYVDASARTSEALFYFQGLPRGPLTFMPSFCHVTNSRLEVAVNTWQCWWQQGNPAQPNYTGELNLSAGVLKSNVGKAVASINKLVRVKAIKGANFRGPDDPLDPQVVIGYQVINDGKVVFSKIGDNVLPEANKVASQQRLQKRQQILGDFEKTGKSLGEHGEPSGASGNSARAEARRCDTVPTVRQSPNAGNGGSGGCRAGVHRGEPASAVAAAGHSSGCADLGSHEGTAWTAGEGSRPSERVLLV